MTAEQGTAPTYTIVRRNGRVSFNRVGIAAFIVALAAPILALLATILGGLEGFIVLRDLSVVSLGLAVASLFIRNRRNVFGYLALALSVAGLALCLLLLQLLAAALSSLTF